ncbi:MAG: thymidylate synthase [Armatimonadetes bacterium]|nr:thymidylate synthase [Armatimonadota bacterium]
MPENESVPGEFVPLYFGNKLRVVNPRGRVGILTLWSKIEFVEKTLADLKIDLGSETSKIAVIGNLYGNGIPHLLRNLLYNPQIRHLVICGANRSGSAEDIVAFFRYGLEKTMSLGETVTKIVDRSRIIDDMVTPEHFTVQPQMVMVGELRDKESREYLYDVIQSFSPEQPITGERMEIELPEVCVTHYPSEPRNHNIVADTPLTAWRELIFRLVRFGHLVQLRKGDRQELQNVRVVVRYPQLDDDEDLKQYNFSREELIQYQHDMLVGPLPEDHSYTYGNRIREYYGFDALDKFADRLRDNPQDRDCYLALWDSRRDIDSDDAPCLVSLFFRVYDDQLTLTATYRTHNALDAWLKNVYGLMKAQKIVAEKSGLEVGALTVISHSISVDPSKYDIAKRVANSKTFSLEIDPNGQLMVSVEEGEIIVRHSNDDGVVLNEYRSKKAERIQHELNRDCVISDINHAMYIGRQLAKAENCIRTGEKFEEG